MSRSARNPKPESFGRSAARFREDVRNLFRWPIERARARAMMAEKISGKRVLIAGTGPSANELGGAKIPSDVLIFTCKRGLALFTQPVDVYMCWKGFLKRTPAVAEEIRRVGTDILIADDRGVLRGHDLESAVRRVVVDDGKDNHYLKKLIRPHGLAEIRRVDPALADAGVTSVLHASSGLRLLQYALHFGAREIYLIGIDLSNEGYFFGGEKKQKHLQTDRNFLAIVSKKYPNVFSLSKSSAITSYLPYKSF